MKRKLSLIILATSLALGAAFRFYNLDWDRGHYFHPDERNVALAVTRIRFFNQMDPEFFAYGSLPIYMYRAAAEVMVKITGNQDWISDWGKINVIGRYFSAFFSTLTILLVYFLARKILSPDTAIVAAWFTAFSPFLIQQAHFAVTESELSFWAVLLTILSLALLKKQNLVRIILLAYLYAAAVATKVSAISFGIIPAVILLWLGFQKGFSVRHTVRTASVLLIFLTASALMYAALSPYTLLSWNKFMESMRYEGGIVSGKLIVVYVYQFLRTKPYLYQLAQLPYTQGFIPAVVSIVGFIWIIAQSVKQKKWLVLFVFLWPTFYFAYVGGWYAKFVRYLVPVYPFLAIAASFFVIDLTNRMRRGFALSRVAITILLIVPFLRTVAFMHIYTTQQTRVSASAWIYEHVPKSAKILTEHWDDGLPITLSPVQRPEIYRSEQLTIYEPDNEKKVEYYGEKLTSADYVVISSRRLYGTLINLEEKYPVTSHYYKLLFDGSLGYEKVAEFAEYPTLQLDPWKWEFNDDGSEESFQVYDHPKIMIFQNTRRFPPEQIIKQLTGSPSLL